MKTTQIKNLIKRGSEAMKEEFPIWINILLPGHNRQKCQHEINYKRNCLVYLFLNIFKFVISSCVTIQAPLDVNKGFEK